MVMDDVFKVLDFGEVDFKVAPVLFDDFVAEVVDHAFHEVEHFLGEEVGFPEAGDVGNFGGLEVKPYTVELPLHEFTPEEVAEEGLVLAEVFLVDDEVEGECAVEIQAEVVDCAGLLLDEGLVGGQLLELEGLDAVDLFVKGGVLEFTADVLLVGVTVSRGGADEELEQVLEFVDGDGLGLGVDGVLGVLGVEVLLGAVHEVHEEVAKAQEEVALD
jgi:hypothetical protein